MTFNTIEDVNGTQFDNQGFWWYELDTACIDPDGTAEFENVKVDFLTITKEKIVYDGVLSWKYTIVVDNEMWTGGFYSFNSSGHPISYTNTSITMIYIGDSEDIIKPHNWHLKLYMGNLKVSSQKMEVYYLLENEIGLNLKELEVSHQISVVRHDTGNITHISQMLEKGYNELSWIHPIGYLLVKLIKTNFEFDCNQVLKVGEVNTIILGTATDYKQNGALVGDYETKLSVLYDSKTIPIMWNESVNDYTFDLDLTNKTDESKIRFKVLVEVNDVLNASETDVTLESSFETIDTLSKLQNLFNIGGTGRLSNDLTLTNDLILTKSVNLIGNDCSIDMASHKISVGSDLTFKAQTVNFSNGVNTIQQEPNSNVELSDCSFTDCTGFGSVIDCQVDPASLDDSDDFNTKLTNCTIANCDIAILSGGNLEVDGCTVNGKISNKNYPFFLYQTDGNATILNSQFNLSSDTEYDYDLEFNTCIFICGETAIINGYSHTELQNNNITAFFDTQRNTSTIDVKYYYSLIEDTVHLQSSKGFCHSVSGVDYIFKSNVTITRGE